MTEKQKLSVTSIKHRKHERKNLMKILTILCFFSQTISAQNIPNNFFGINHWMPDKFLMFNATTPPIYPHGAVDFAPLQNMVQQTGVTFYRIGGDQYDKFGIQIGSNALNNDYIAAIAKIKSFNSGAKFLIQIPFGSEHISPFTPFTPANAATLVQNIASAYPTDQFYYTIGNEWDIYYEDCASPPCPKRYDWKEIATFIREYSFAMKNADQTIKIVAPALTRFDGEDKDNIQIIPQIFSNTGDQWDISDIINEPGTNAADGLYYVDVLDFHSYKGGTTGGDMSGMTLSNFGANRTSSIDYPNNGLVATLNNLQARLAIVNADRLGSKMTWAITEMNIAYSNPPYNAATDENPTALDKNSVYGLGCRSFFAGQFWADFISGILKNGRDPLNNNLEFVCPWSVHEGGAVHGTDWNNEIQGNGSIYDLGMTKGPADQDDAPIPLSTYWHYYMLANNFKGDFLPNMTALASGFKAFAYKNTTGNEIGVMILNQNQSGGPNSFEIEFDGVNAPTSEDINILINGGNSNNYNCSIKTESTILLKFDLSGNIISRTEYSLEDAITDGSPRTWKPAVLPTADDVYIKDTPADDGSEPNPNLPWHIVDGTDVWVRNSAATATSTNPDHFQYEHQHENVEFSGNWATSQSSRPRIYTKIRNRGCSTISGNLRLYYHKLSTSDQWNGTLNTGTNTYGYWEEILCGDNNGDGIINSGTETLCLNSITLQPGEEWVVEQIWNNVAQTSVFTNPLPAGSRNEWCLLARFESAADPIVQNVDEFDNVSAANNAQRSNNIVQKNVVFVEETPGIICSPFDVGNYTPASTVNELKIIDESSVRFIENQGTLTLDLGKPLYDAWVQGGRQGSGIVDKKSKYNHMSSSGIKHSHSPQGEDPKPYVVAITSTLATLGNIQLSPQQIESICPTFNYFSGEASTQPHEIYFAQFESKNNAPMVFNGAVKYVIDKPNCPKVNAGSDVTVGKICSTTLTASPILEGATYVWRNNSNGTTVGTGSSLVVSPHVTTTYELEMITPNHCIDYDVVTVSVNSNIACQSGCGPVDYFNVTLSSNTVIDEKTVVVGGVLKVPNNVILTVTKSKMLFTENSGIEVMAGGKLVILNSELRPCDITKKWKGISIKGNNSDANQLSVSEAHFYDATSPLVMDKVNGASILGNTFDNGSTAISMDKCKNFTIAKNEFYIYNIGVYATNSILDVKSMINENYFYKVRISVQLENGNHTKLDIKCNVFEAYDDYAILSKNSTLQDQGNATEGAGNLFISNSTKLNDKLNHNGNSMKYYYDPSNPVSLVTGNSLNALAQPAATDGSCNQYQNARMADLASENLKEEISKDKMNVYAVPNPNSGLAAIYFNLGEGTQGDLIVMDIYGKVIDRIKINSGSNKVEVDYSQYANGVYLLSLTNSNGESVNRKMIIAK
ncbi:MAG: C-terminal target protein [Bacteroidota bacterium]|jgi:hypothetical protein|nr:C-terminal target protein [Bacteroidota bacterium]